MKYHVTYRFDGDSEDERHALSVNAPNRTEANLKGYRMLCSKFPVSSPLRTFRIIDVREPSDEQMATVVHGWQCKCGAVGASDTPEIPPHDCKGE